MATRSVHKQKRYNGLIRYGREQKHKESQSQLIRDDSELFGTTQAELYREFKNGSPSVKESIISTFISTCRDAAANKGKSPDYYLKTYGREYFTNGQFDEKKANKFGEQFLKHFPNLGKKLGVEDIAIRTMLLDRTPRTERDKYLMGVNLSDSDKDKLVNSFSPFGTARLEHAGSLRPEFESEARGAKTASLISSMGNDEFKKFKKAMESKPYGKKFGDKEDFAADVLENQQDYADMVEDAASRPGVLHQSTASKIYRALTNGGELTREQVKKHAKGVIYEYGAPSEEVNNEIGKRIGLDMNLSNADNWKNNYTARAIAEIVTPLIESHQFKTEDWRKALAYKTSDDGKTPVLTYDQVSRFAKKPRSVTRTKVEKYTKQWGIKLLGFPEKEQKKKKEKTGSKGAKKSSSGSYGTSGGIFSTGGTKMQDRPLFGKTADVKIVGGETVYTQNKSRMRDWWDSRKKGLRGKTPAEKLRAFNDKYSGVMPRYRYEDAIKKGNWLDRVRLHRQARKMATDPVYNMNQRHKWQVEEDIAKAKLIRAKREGQQQMRAATSTWYSAWYRFSKYTKWIAMFALLAAILFLPMGLFYVLGWALAVGVIALFQFIIWVFMEFWFLVAQAMVAVVGLVGQAFVMAINWVGKTLGSTLGQTYKPFDYQLVQNMLMFERDSAGVYHVYYYNNAVTGKSEILTWGALNLTPPKFLSLELFKPTWFDTQTIFGHLVPPVSAFFNWLYGPIATRYTGWISDPNTPWYWPGIIIGVPVIIIIIVIFLIYRFMKRRVYA